ncbi:MAG: CoA protein activase [Nitrospirae bacterium]|nr:MAG: CoA protein activase [Nitrospirota bacterium]
MHFIGLDAGSVSVKLSVLDNSGRKLEGRYVRHCGHPAKVAFEQLKDLTQKYPAPCLSITGSGGKAIASAFGIKPVNEIVSQSYSLRKLYPLIRTVIEMGGEDSKLIIIEDGNIKDFSLNSVCAAGTGSFLEQQAERLRLTIEEFSKLAVASKRPSKIAGRCSVFAKSDMIHLQQIATPVEDIVAGLCFAVARNFRGAIAKGRELQMPVAFQGGVAANQGVARAFREVFGLDELFIPPDYALMGAIGAVMKDMDDRNFNEFDLGRLEAFLDAGFSEEGYKALIHDGEDFFARHTTAGNACSGAVSGQKEGPPVEAYLGIDIGSISTNLAVIDAGGRLLAKRYLMTAGRPIEAVMQGFTEIYGELGGSVNIAGVGTTGSGRYMIADYVGADIVKNEITAQATAAIFIDPEVDTILEIGGQDSKFISIKDGIIVDFEMNKACAAGTGSFLEEQAEKLSISVKGEFADAAFSAESPCRLGERCTVFMENSLMANLQKGAPKDNLLAGLAYSIVQNYINRVVSGRPIGERIFFQGGVAFNKAVVAAFERYLDRKVTVPPNHDVTGAIGMALIAMKHMKSRSAVNSQQSTVGSQQSTVGSQQSTVGSQQSTVSSRQSTVGSQQSTVSSRQSTVNSQQSTVNSQQSTVNSRQSAVSRFKGFGLSKRKYEINSFECKGCPNVCEINRVKVEDDNGHLFYGGRCEKYDVRKASKSGLPDLFAFREEELWKEQLKRESAVGSQRSAVKIGIPYIFYFQDYLPFWSTLLWELGFEVTVSPKTNKQTVNLGLENVLSEACFPVKVAHGHIKHLMDSGVDAVFVPSFICLNGNGDEYDRGLACPHIQSIPYVSKAAIKGVNMISPLIDSGRGGGCVGDEIYKALKRYGVSRKAVSAAMDKALSVQKRFVGSIKDKGREILSNCTADTPILAIVGRAYNSFDSGVNLDIPKKLAQINVLSVPMDFLPIEDERLSEQWPGMYWRSGQRILKAARFIRKTPGMYAMCVSNFSCGPDSFIFKYFGEEMGGKPFLHIEIDEHSADAGVITRCEAFLDSIGQQISCGRGESPDKINTASAPEIFSRSDISRRTVFVPPMSDHAFAIKAAFEYCGARAEVLPESDRSSVDIGRRHVSGKECYPYTVTAGDMLKKALSPDFVPSGSAFFMPSGTGPCRFGQYNVAHGMILKKIGMDNVPIFSPNQDVQFYKELGVVGGDFTKRTWTGVIAYEFLTKCVHETRPYEKEQGDAEELYVRYHEKIHCGIAGRNGDIEGVLSDMSRDFRAVPRREEKRPLIGVVGEIFVRSHRFSNEGLVRKIESSGGEVWLAPVEEWLYYVNAMSMRKALIKRDGSAIMNIFAKTVFQKRIEHRLGKPFKGFLKTLEEPSTKTLLKKALPYVHHSFEGETVLSIGKAVDLIEKGASGIIVAMPFGCMPGTIVSALMKTVAKDFGIPCISIPYDGTESPATALQLEAFMEAAKNK